jgi:hypothetical protein
MVEISQTHDESTKQTNRKKRACLRGGINHRTQQRQHSHALRDDDDAHPSMTTTTTTTLRRAQATRKQSSNVGLRVNVDFNISVQAKKSIRL